MTKLFYDGFSSKEIERFEKYLKHILDNLTDFEADMGKGIIPNSHNK